MKTNFDFLYDPQWPPAKFTESDIAFHVDQAVTKLVYPKMWLGVLVGAGLLLLSLLCGRYEDRSFLLHAGTIIGGGSFTLGILTATRLTNWTTKLIHQRRKGGGR